MNIANDNINIAELSKIEDVCLSIVDKNGKFICYSKGCENIEHYKQCDVLGKKPNDLYHQAEISEKEKSRSLIMETLKRKKAITRNINVYETNHNKTITSICSTYPVFDENHKLHFVLCVYNEITDYLNMMSVINKQKLEIESRNKFEFCNVKKYIFDSIMGESVAIKNCINQAKTAATTKEAVLLYGETGTGKELFAQSIHNQSARAKINFVAVNCATIPENLLEATLFGTCKGSFTGAVHSKGLLEEAKGSTLFLDEINSMDLKMQSKLLRVLETEKYRKVGASEEQRCDVRIISAINEDPFKAIAANRFRSDLYYRLAVFTINIPPLNARKKDLMLLSDYFIENLSPMLGKKIARL
ncbi:MAG: sigma 54-interacting transcriptional regulator, partial [Eubacterium sp.]